MRKDRIVWRWDQGHQEYLQFANLKAQARVFASLDGLVLSQDDDPLRQPLVAGTGLTFASPETHKVWRQYKRAFQVGLLVQEVNGQLNPTEVCRLLAVDAAPGVVADDFLLLFARRFRLPFPGFNDYCETSEEVFPAAAVVKLLLAKAMSDPRFGVDASAALQYIEGNCLTGREELDVYEGIELEPLSITDDEKRQTREMLAFLSQISWLHWEDSTLKLAGPVTQSFAHRYSADLSPDVDIRTLPRAVAFSRLTSIEHQVEAALSPDEDSDHLRFFEGNKRAVTHLRIERNRRLRQMVLSRLSTPAECDACGMDPNTLYEWTQDFFDVHHLLPLAAPITRTSRGTSLEDVVAVCPNCHRAIHAYYGLHLRQNRLADFESLSHARLVYQEVREKIRTDA